MTSEYRLSPEELPVLADALGEGPDRVISIARLLGQRCRAYVLGDPAHFEAAIVQDDLAPAEPAGYGESAVALWQLLQTVPDWTCINVAEEVSAELGGLMRTAMARSDVDISSAGKIRYYGDVYYSLEKPLQTIPDHTVGDATVRRLTLKDRPLLMDAPDELKRNLGDMSDLITEHPLAAAIVDGSIVAVAQIYAESRKYADIGVFTLKDRRGGGLATTAAAILIRDIQTAGKTPAWSTGEDNHASMRVAEKLGFTEKGRRWYVIPL